MRKKDEILRNAKTDIANSKASFPTSYWLRYRELEVLIDIRDALVISEKVLTSIYDSIVNTD